MNNTYVQETIKENPTLTFALILLVLSMLGAASTYSDESPSRGVDDSHDVLMIHD